jgi:hypothetical protein
MNKNVEPNFDDIPFESFDDIMFPPVAFDDVRDIYATPKHLTRADARRWERASRRVRIERFDRELMIFGIVIGATCVFLFAVGAFAMAVMR